MLPPNEDLAHILMEMCNSSMTSEQIIAALVTQYNLNVPHDSQKEKVSSLVRKYRRNMTGLEKTCQALRDELTSFAINLDDNPFGQLSFDFQPVRRA